MDTSLLLSPKSHITAGMIGISAFCFAGLVLAAPTSSIPTPESVLGFAPASRAAHHHEILRYFEALAASSPRATLTEMGKTYEGRRLFYLTVSAEANMKRLEQIRSALSKLGAGQGLSRAQSAEIARTTPAVAWLGYSIHGNELSGADAALQVAQRLVGAEDHLTVELRRSLVVHIDPNQNPDGRERFLAQVGALRGVVPDLDQASVAHTGLWPYGRGNHYFFDLNRDWLLQVHPESRARVVAVTHWLPQMVVDAHEMDVNSTYLFSPGRHPFNPHVPANVARWAHHFAADQAAAFDKRGWSYFTREWNEEFFPGYGSSWLGYAGSIGILYEQAKSAGSSVRQQDGKTLRYAETVEHQVVSTFANLETLARHRVAILSGWAADRGAAVDKGARGPMRAWVIPPGRDPGRSALLAGKLLGLGIEVKTNPSPVRAGDLHSVWDPQGKERELPPWSYLIRLDQPEGGLIHNILDFHQPMEKAFLREERQWIERGKGSRIYETTAWSFPLAYGVAALWSGKIPPGKWVAVDSGKIATIHRTATGQSGEAGEPSPQYGLLFAGSTDSSVFLLAALLNQGILVRVGKEPFTFNGRPFERGAVLIRNEDNPTYKGPKVASMARRLGVTVHAVDSGKIAEGPDLGGGQFLPTVPPRIGILTGDPVRAQSYGHLWHLLDRHAGVRASGLDIGYVGDFNLAPYNVLVLPPIRGNSKAYGRRLGSRGLAALKEWVKAGGTLIGIGNGARFLADEQTSLVSSRPRHQVLAQYPPVVLGLAPLAAERAGRFRASGLRPTPAKPKDGSVSGRWLSPASPYDIPPVVGPGARAFLPAGASVFTFPKTRGDLEAWAAPLAPVGDDKAKKAFLQRADERLQSFYTRGSFLAAEIDPEHWLGYGSPGRIPVLHLAPEPLIAEGKSEVVARFSDVEQLHLSGLLWPEHAGRVARTAYLVREKVGRGQVILFNGDPAFRGFCWATQRLFLNAVLLGPGLGTQTAPPW